MKKISILLMSLTLLSTQLANATKNVKAQDLNLHVSHFFIAVEGQPPSAISLSQYELLSNSVKAHKSMSEDELKALVGAEPITPGQIRANLDNMKLFRTFRLSVTDLVTSMELTEPEYNLLTILLDAQKEMTVSDISLLMAQNESQISNVPDFVGRLNLKAEQFLRRTLILENQDKYFLDRETPDYRGVKFQFNSPGRGIVYRGHAVDIAPLQVKLLKIMDAAPKKLATYDIIGTEMGWNGRSLRAKVHAYIAEMNRRAIEDSGAPIAEIIEEKGAKLTVIPKPQLPQPLTVDTILGPMTFEGQERLIFETLGLSAEPSAGILEVSEAAFLQIGLSLPEFNQSIKAINHKILKLKGDILIRESHVQIKGELFFSHFFRSGNSHTEKRRPTARDCWPWLVKD